MNAMGDRLLARALNTVVALIITFLAAGTLLTGYLAILRLSADKPLPAAGWIVLAMLLAFGAGMVIRHRDDLADR